MIRCLRLQNEGESRAGRFRVVAGLVWLTLLCAPLAALAASSPAGEATDATAPPNVVVITVDALRADRLSAYGYGRKTSPRLDGLIASGVKFTQARTVEPLTAPALGSLLLSCYPHEHGATRNGLRLRPGLESLPLLLGKAGYRTAAFVSNWTLRDKLTSLGNHFDDYEEVLNRRRWKLILRNEGEADEVTGSAVEWIREHVARNGTSPFMIWAHYTEPHAPYRLRQDRLAALGMEGSRDYPPSDRYDTEISYCDDRIGVLLDEIERLVPRGRTLIVFAADHGESLGEHDYWGHGRNLYEQSLRIPMAIAWPGHLDPAVVDAPAMIIDIAPTVLGLAGLGSSAGFRGYDWTDVLGGAPPPGDRITRYEAHKGAVQSNHDSDSARAAGLLSVGILRGGRKEILLVRKGGRMVFDLANDPGETNDLSPRSAAPGEGALAWMRRVREGLDLIEAAAPPQEIDEESIERLKALGYID